MSEGPAPGSSLRLGFAGTPAFAARILEALLASEHIVALAFTQPDRPAGRRRQPTPSPVRRLAAAHGVPVRTPASLRGEASSLAGLDALVVAAYGLLLPPAALAAPKRGCLNVHASLLPRWRGAAPIERAIMAGDADTGVSIMRMDAGLDTGPVLLRRRVSIERTETGATLQAKLACAGAAALLHCLDRLDTLAAQIQDDAQATLAPKLTAADSVIDWARPAIDIERQVRALAGRQSAWATLAGQRVNILAARAASEAGAQAGWGPGCLRRLGRDLAVGCGAGALILDTVQVARGKGRPMSSRDAANGYPALFQPGRCFDAAA